MLKHTVCYKKIVEMHIAVTICFVTDENLEINKKNYSIFAWYVPCVAHSRVSDHVTNAD